MQGVIIMSDSEFRVEKGGSGGLREYRVIVKIREPERYMAKRGSGGQEGGPSREYRVVTGICNDETLNRTVRM